VRITRLRLRDLKVHRDLDLELAPGLTVVRGPNEAGKTTLQRALELALFGVNSREAALSEPDLEEPFGPVVGEPPVMAAQLVRWVAPGVLTERILFETMLEPLTNAMAPAHFEF
jgi:energy-coupling factor transporter ATP-binding protein EcfA2